SHVNSNRVLTSDHATSPRIGNEHLRWRLLCCVRRWPCLFLQLRLRSAVPHSQLPHSLAAAVGGAMGGVSAGVILGAGSGGVILAAGSVAATWPDTSVVSMAAMSMANFATVSAATAIRPTVTIPTALIMGAIRPVQAATNVCT